MKIRKLLKEVPLAIYKGSQETEIAGLCAHSKRVAPGDLFLAKRGHTEDGAQYIEEAVAAGAAAVVSEMGNPFLSGVTQLIHPDVASIEGPLAAAFYGHPAESLFTVGVTGTSGKTSVTTLIKHLLDCRTGLIGTIEYDLGDHTYPATLTTPDAITNQKLLREMCNQKCQAALLEVSSHALMQGRVEALPFDCALFTNLSHDHLDYHGTFEAYAAAKSRLFTSLSPEATAVINADDPWSERMVQACQAHILTYGLSEKATLRATDLDLSIEGSAFTVSYQGQTARFTTPQLGRFSILNTLAALSVPLIRGTPLAALVPRVASFPGVPGRLERIGSHPIFVDYAHKPDALKNVLQTLREVSPSPLTVVFGCGGDRDRDKRPQMAAIAEQLADHVIVTSDNPRSEDPHAICHEIAAGFTKSNHHIEPDRKTALSAALQKEGLILIAGKGHEKTQIFAHHTLPFDDRQVLEEFL